MKNSSSISVSKITHQKLVMSEFQEKMDACHFEESVVTQSPLNDQPALEIYHENGALTVNMREARGDIGGRLALKLAKDGYVSRFFEFPSSWAEFANQNSPEFTDCPDSSAIR